MFRVARVGDPDAYLKIGRDTVCGDIVDEAVRLRWIADRLPCAPLRAFALHDDTAWLLTGAVAGRTGDAWLEEDGANLPMVIAAFAGFARALHALPVDECPFDASAPVRLAAARRRVAASLVDLDDFDDDHEGWSAEQVLAAAEALLPVLPGKRVVTHGDFSLGNLLIDADGKVTGCIDVGRLGQADRYQDLAILWQNLSEFGPEAQQAFLHAYGVSVVDERRRDFHRLLDELF